MKKIAVLMGLLLVLALAIAPVSTLVRGKLDPVNTSLPNQEVENQGSAEMALDFSECTLGVNHAEITSHESPVLWKVLDTPSNSVVAALPDDFCMVVKYYEAEEWGVEFDSVVIVYDYEGIEPHKYITGGLNEAGVGAGHTYAEPDEGIEIPAQSHLLYDILGVCGTMDGIRDYLDQGVGNGMWQESGCYGFIDNEDQAVMFEVDTSLDRYWEYDTQDADRYDPDPDQNLWGFVVRANEFHRQEDGTDDTSILRRYLTGTENTRGMLAAGQLDEQTAVQSASDNINEYRLIRQSEIPWPISRNLSYAALAIRGAAEGEDPALATMWALLGNPSFAIAVPTWAAVSEIPEPIGTCAMYNAATTLFNITSSNLGKLTTEAWVQSAVLPAEAHLFAMVNERLLPHWRMLGSAPDGDEMTRIEHQMAWDAYRVVNYLATTQELNLAPTVDFEAWQLVGHAYVFNSTADDADGDVVSYEWNFGDGNTSAEIAPEYKFKGPGVYLVSLTVADDDGVTTTSWRYLTVPAE